MRYRKFLLVVLSVLSISVCQAQKSAPLSVSYPIAPVPFTSVKVAHDSFWGQRLEASRIVTIPLAFSKCESEGRYKNFELAAAQLRFMAEGSGNKTLSPSGEPVGGYSFDDTDPYKTIEGASYILQTYPDDRLKAYIDSVLTIIGAAQEPDGYLYTARTQNPLHPHPWSGDARWTKEEDLSHELYNLGHMVESAVAHWQATGSRKFLDIACRYADCVVREVGPEAGQACVVPGHQIAEMALCKLYLATGEKKYLDEAKLLLDYRGKTTIKQQYSQSHKPVVEQDEAVGHAVRAAYMYAGMADVAALTGDTAYINAIDRIWENIVGKKLYITGGIGATNAGEAFGRNYELPNMTAYCETCAAIGNVYVNHRLFLMHGDSKYYDVLERTLYNGLISGVSLDGGSFYYPNPLASAGQHKRQAWFGCACCPSNICRFIPSLPGYVYAVKAPSESPRGETSLYVNLFMPNTATLTMGKKAVTLTQETAYPYAGDITIKVDKTNAGEFAMKIRVPGWVKNAPVPSDLYAFSDQKTPNYTATVNGVEVDATALTDDGYLTISRKWKKGDVVRLHLDMDVRVVKANERVSADRGQVAVERGPLVYCAEWADNAGFNINNIVMNQHPQFTEGELPVADFIPADSKERLNAYKSQSIVTLTTDAQALSFGADGRLNTRDVRLTLIPYFAWAHRGSGDMRVWLPATSLEVER